MLSELLPIIFFPFAVCIGYPYLALVPAILFALIYFKSKKNFIGITALLWLLYAIYETLNFFRITCSGECNIRVDLILIAPLLGVMTLMALTKIISSRNTK